MSTVFDLLRETREQRRMTLTDVADATLININFLKAIDEGRTDVLPSAYVRAFMREYASVVGLDPNAVMQQFDRERQGLSGEAPVPAAAGPVAPEPAAPPARGPSPVQAPYSPQADAGKSPEDKNPRYTLIAVVLVVLSVMAIILWNILGRERTVVREVPFQDVIKENEQHAVPESSKANPDTVGSPRQAPAVMAPPAIDDSLTLRVRTAARVWMKVTADNESSRKAQGREYPADTTLVRRAKNRFRLSVGNAGAVRLALNGRDLGTLGKAGALVQGAVVTTRGIAVPDTTRRAAVRDTVKQ